MFLSFLENKKRFNLFAGAFAILCMISIILIVKIDLTVANNVCLVILASVYIFLYLVLFLRDQALQWISSGRCTGKHVVISFLLAAVILFLCGLNAGSLRAGNERGRRLRQSNSLIVSTDRVPGRVTIRGIVYQGADYNLWQVPLSDPWHFTEEGYITTEQPDAAPLSIPLQPAQIRKVYVLTGPDAGNLVLQAGSMTAVYSLLTDEPGERILDLKDLADPEWKEAPVFLNVLLWLLSILLLFFVLLPIVVHFQYLFQKNKQPEPESGG